MENREIVEKAIKYVKEHATESELSIEDVATHAGFSMDYFNRMFLARTGYNIMEYVRHERLKQAAAFLRYPPKKQQILEVALKFGYTTSESFSRAFKKEFGMNPSEYQEKMASTQHLSGDDDSRILLNMLSFEFPQFKHLNMEETIDYLLSKDSKAMAAEAVRLRILGGGAFYENTMDEGFILFYNNEGKNEEITGTVFSTDFVQIAKYLKLFDSKRFRLLFRLYSKEHAQKTQTQILDSLKEAGIPFDSTTDTLSSALIRICTETLPLPQLKDKPKFRELTFDDHDAITAFLNPRKLMPYSTIQTLNYSLKKRDVMGNTDHPLHEMGLFVGGKLLGMVHYNVVQTRNFKMAMDFMFFLDQSLATDELYRYAFVYIVNQLVEQGVAVYDENHYKSEQYPNAIDAGELGFQTIGRLCHINYNEK